MIPRFLLTSVAGFTLGDALGDFDLEPEPEPAPAPAVARQAYTAPVTAVKLSSSEPLFFPYPPVGMPADEVNPTLLARSWTSGTFRRFRRTGTDEDIAARHEERRSRLNERVRSRHREATRLARRRGAALPVLFGESA